MDAIFALIDQETSMTKIPEDIVDGSAFGAVEAQQELLAAMTSSDEEEQQVQTALQASAVASDEAAQIESFTMPPSEYFVKGRRHQLIFEGVCTHCAHCGQPLTDSVSVERGIGPICSKKGYAEDPKVSDEIQALIDLAEFPVLVDYITEKYKPQGIRPMMNALVKICSLNRRSPVHSACTDAIESLGFSNLASTLRESIAVVEIKECKEHPDNYIVWVKKSDWNWGWTRAVRTLEGSFASRQLKGTVIPMRHKRALWEFMLQFYGGLCATVVTNGTKRTFKLVRKKVDDQKVTSDISATLSATSK